MILYHGINMEVREPRIINTNRGLDFGAGFYTTTSLEQAKKWAISKTGRLKTGLPVVSVYEFDSALLNGELDYKEFLGADGEWLDFVCANRKGSYKGPLHDIVCGPIANDRTIIVVNDYLAGAYDTETALLLLKTAKLSNQYTFLTFRSIRHLKFQEVIKC